MNAFRFLTKALGLAVPVLYLGIAVPALANEAEEALRRGVELFDAGDYLAAQQALLAIDRDDLSEADGARRDDYLERIQVALTMLEKASKDYEDGEQALTNGDLDRAEARLNEVLANEYAPQALRSSTVQLLRKVAEQRDIATAPAAPAPVDAAPSPKPATQAMPSPAVAGEGTDFERASVLIRQGHEALEGGRTREAIRLFEQALKVVPGHPDAVEGIELAQSYQDAEIGPDSLLNRMRRSDEIRWQRTVAAYREAERDIREHIMNDRYDLAEPRIIEALQTIEAGRQYARPLVKYESIKAQAEALNQYLKDEQRAYEERKVRQARDEIEQKRRERNEAVRRAKREQVEALMSQASQHRKNGELPESIAVLKEVVAIDPQNDRARWMLDDLEDLYQLVHQREIQGDKRRGVQGVLTDTEESKVPIDKLLIYPDNWLELISGPERVPPGREQQSPADRNLQAKLDRRIPVDYDGQALAKVIDDLAHEMDVNVAVAWNDLEAQGIQRDDPVNLRFPTEMTFRKALGEILDQAGGNVELGFAAKDGLIKVATKDQLDRDVYTEVYPIEDLLMAVPDYNYDGPPFGIQQGRPETVGGRFASATFDRTGGGFGEGEFGGRERESGRRRRGHTEDDDERQVRVDDLLDLIRNTIEPNSWRDNGGAVAAIAELGGQLVVTQTSAAHAEVADLLSKLRAQRALQVGIETRFLTITSNYLEEMGIDLDIFLNQGNAGYDPVLGPSGETILLPRSQSRLGFMPGVPGVGTPLQQVPTINQPYGVVGAVPQSGNGLIHGSNMTPIPIVSNVLDLAAPGPTGVSGTFGAEPTPAMSVFGSFLDGIQVDFLLRATQADRRNSVMNAPRLVLFNGQRAWVGVFNTTNYVQSVLPITDEQAVAQAPQVAQLLTGTKLEVRATVSADRRYVTMNLEPDLTEQIGELDRFPFSGGAAGAAAADAFIQLPRTAGQSIRTTVTVPDGGTLLFGGLKRTAEVEIEAGVPVLSKIPILKRLYSNRSLVKDEQVLLILVKPTIIIQSETEERAFPTFTQEG